MARAEMDKPVEQETVHLHLTPTEAARVRALVGAAPITETAYSVYRALKSLRLPDVDVVYTIQEKGDTDG